MLNKSRFRFEVDEVRNLKGSIEGLCGELNSSMY